MNSSENQYGLNEYKLLASICRESYYEFFKEFWEYISPEPLQLSWHIELICEELQNVAERVFAGKVKKHDLIINISPGTTKSSAASIAFLPWCWSRMPTLKSINGSHTHELVLDLSRRSRDIIYSDKYRKCFPEIELKDDQNTKGYYGNTHMGSRFSCTVAGKTPTGMHGHIHVLDDPIDPKKAVSDVELAAANTWMSETLSTRKIDKAITPLCLIMQRLAQNDPSGYILSKASKNKKVRHICLPAEITENVHPPYLKKYYVNGLMDPKRLSRKVLREYKEEGDYFYAGQFLQHPVPLGGGMFKTDMLQIEQMAPAPAELKKVVRYWDNAGSPRKKDRKRAYTVGILMALDRYNRVWVLDVIRVRLDVFRREKLKYQTAQSDNLRYPGMWTVQEQEGGSGGQESAENTVRNLAGFRVKIDFPKGEKELRADPFADQVNGRNVHLVKAGWNNDYIDEMKYFPYSTYKDQIDGSSGAFAAIFKLKRRVGAIRYSGETRSPNPRVDRVA